MSITTMKRRNLLRLRLSGTALGIAGLAIPKVSMVWVRICPGAALVLLAA
jgi:hypothetical protein